MTDGEGAWVVTNAQFYNHPEVRKGLPGYRFRTSSDTETFLAAYQRWGPTCVERFRGMFSLALWDQHQQHLFCARDRFGIKPFYYTVVEGVFYCCSEAKALLPLLPEVATDEEALQEYLALQFCLNGKTLFRGIKELPAGHTLSVKDGQIRIERYWDFPPLRYAAEACWQANLREACDESIKLEMRSDVPIGVLLSGGVDSSLVAAVAANRSAAPLPAFHGFFAEGPEYDERRYAQSVCQQRGLSLHTVLIRPRDLVGRLESILYHLDFPVAGPGCLGQFLVAEQAAKLRKVVLCGQGGDELFGGYARYLIAMGETVPGYESASRAIESYSHPCERFLALIHRGQKESLLESPVFQKSLSILEGQGKALEPRERMARFDLSESLRGLLQVEDRVSMAHGLESRAPFLDHRLAELALSLPAALKFTREPKQILKQSLGAYLPPEVQERTDKMGFPIPLIEWLSGPLTDFIADSMTGRKARSRDYVNNVEALAALRAEPRYGRQFWGLLCLELWQQTFHDKAHEFRAMLQGPAGSAGGLLTLKGPIS